MHSFRVWYVQCLPRILALNLLQFIQSKVWRSFDSLAVKYFMKTVCKIRAFILKLFSDKSNFRSRKYLLVESIPSIISRSFKSFGVNKHKTNPMQVVDGSLKKQRNISKVPSQSTSHNHRSSGWDEALDRQDLWEITWPAVTRAVSRGRERTLETRLLRPELYFYG